VHGEENGLHNFVKTINLPNWHILSMTDPKSPPNQLTPLHTVCPHYKTSLPKYFSGPVITVTLHGPKNTGNLFSVAH
jgi:hypothetical protein